MSRDIMHYAKTFKGVIENDFCQQVISELQDAEYQQHKFYSPGDNETRPRSGAQELDVTFSEIPSRELMMKKMWPVVRRYVDELKMPWFDSWQGYSRVRFNRYSENRKMALHADHIQSLFDGERKGIPTLSILGLLNDNFKGGEFVLIDEVIDFKGGDIIIFPSNFMYPHKVEPVLEGTRYSYISWLW